MRLQTLGERDSIQNFESIDEFFCTYEDHIIIRRIIYNVPHMSTFNLSPTTLKEIQYMTSCCWVLASTGFQEGVLHSWAHPCGPDGQTTMPLDIYRPIRFKWTGFAVNPHSGCWIQASAIFQEPLLCPRALPCGPDVQLIMHDIAYLQAKTIWSEYTHSKLLLLRLINVMLMKIAIISMPCWIH